MSDQKEGVSIYHKLTPVSKPDELGEYENALLYALTERDIRNIAITGVYGSGKSSLIKSFEEKLKCDKRFNFLNVSLASFVMEPNDKFLDKKDDKSDEGKDQKAEGIKKSLQSKIETQDIEKSLLQQIIFKVKSDALEDSQFSRIKIKRYIRICKAGFQFLTSHVWTAFFVVSMLLITKFVFKPDYFLFKSIWLFNADYLWFFKIVALIGFMGVVQLIFNWVPKLGLSKFSAGGAEISFNERRGDSILNKHLDELIYFFATTRFNIVVFEDLDRLPTREILIKLREINQLINNSEEINELGINKVVKFVFALGDDLFSDAIDRTKFFDFILPVIPIANYSNSSKKLEDTIKENFPNINFRPNFLDEISPFLGDMRLLFNVANEFIIYKKRLDADDSETDEKLTLDVTKLLATIIYKNKCPDDFADLNQRQGKVWNVINRRDAIIESLSLKLKAQISDLETQVASTESENALDLHELKRSYLGLIFLKHPNLHQFELNGSTRYTPDQLYHDDSIFELLLHDSTRIRYFDRNGNVYQLGSFSTIENEVNPNLGYRQRKQTLDLKHGESLNIKKREINKWKSELVELKRLSLAELCKRSPEFAFSELGNDDLIRYLFLEGLISEDFLSYTSYYYPTELTANDHQFFMAQLAHTKLPFDYKLDRPNKVIDKVTAERFLNASILNFDLLSCLSYNYPSDHNFDGFEYTGFHTYDTSKFENFIRAISHNPYGYDFFYNWFKTSGLRDESKAAVLNGLTYYDKDFWSSLTEVVDHTDSEKIILVLALLKHLSENSLKVLRSTGFVKEKLKDSAELLSFNPDIDHAKLNEHLKLFDIRFSNLEKCGDPKLLEAIENTNSYDLTINNLIKILSRYESSEKTIIPTYTYITSFGSSAVKNYINKEIRWFAESVLKNLDGAEESEQSAVKLLNNEELDFELKVSLIQKLVFNISDIESVADDALWPDLLNSKRVKANWVNVIKYFKLVEQEIDDVLLDYLNDEENVADLITTNLIRENPDDVKLASKLFRSDRLENEIYKKLIMVTRFSFKNLSDLDVNPQKISLLLDAAKFSLSIENYDFLKAKLPNKAHLLIAQYSNDYFNDPTKFDLTNSERVNLVAKSTLSEIHKAELIKLTPESAFDTPLAKAYSEFDLSHSKEKLFNVSIVKAILSFDLAEELKIKVFNRYCDTFDHLAILEAIQNISVEIARLRVNGKPKLNRTDENLEFAKFLERNQYISVSENKKDPTVINLNPKRKILR